MLSRLGSFNRAALIKASATALFILIGSASHIARAEVPMAKFQAPGYYRMLLGKFEITSISDGAGAMPLDKLLINGSPEKINGLLKKNYFNTSVETSINAFLVNTGTQLILVDTGAGKFFGPAIAGRLIANIRKAGYEPEQVNAVLLTHIHTDHSGGLSVDGKKAFQNATVYVAKDELEFWLNPANENKVVEADKKVFVQAKSSLAPYIESGSVKTFTENSEFFPGVTTIATPGHTPGHSVFAIESEGQKLRFWGDLIHAAAVQFPDPEVAIRFDVDGSSASTQRIKALNDAAQQGYWVAAPHISFPGIGHVRKDESGFVWLPANYSMQGLNP